MGIYKYSSIDPVSPYRALINTSSSLLYIFYDKDESAHNYTLSSMSFKSTESHFIASIKYAFEFKGPFPSINHSFIFIYQGMLRTTTTPSWKSSTLISQMPLQPKATLLYNLGRNSSHMMFYVRY
jgi:hypothetical protein